MRMGTRALCLFCWSGNFCDSRSLNYSLSHCSWGKEWPGAISWSANAVYSVDEIWMDMFSSWEGGCIMTNLRRA